MKDSREFLSSNTNGAYSNMSIDGRCRRMYAGYLVASFNSPQDRAVVFEGMDELFRFYEDLEEGGGISEYYADTLAEYRADNAIEYSEEGFIPTMTVRSDVIDYSRRVILSEKHNFVKLITKCTNKNTSDVMLVLEPKLTFRRPDRTASMEELGFTENMCGKYESNDASPEASYCEEFETSFRPTGCHYPGRHRIVMMLKSQSCDMTAERTDRYESGIDYIADRLTGTTYTGTVYIPYRFSCEVSPDTEGEITIVVGVIDENSREELKALRNFFSESEEEADRRGLKEWNLRLAKADTAYREAFFNDAGVPKLAKLYKSLVVSAGKFIVHRKSTGLDTVLAGFPWFLDWGRDTMIALPGLACVTGRYDKAGGILKSFVRYLRNGLMPNVFPADSKELPQYNTADASLWFAYAVQRYISAAPKDEAEDMLSRDELVRALREIVQLYSRSKEEMLAAPADKHCFGIYSDENGLVHAGESEGDQLTWMDVRIDGKAVTPRHGAPVEIQALWYNLLCFIREIDTEDTRITEGYTRLIKRVKNAAMLFYNKEKHCLYDYIDGEPGSYTMNDMVRPNQIFAISVPERADLFPRFVCEEVLETVKEKLAVPLGIRSLAPDEPGYIGEYKGNLLSRDRAYHMGTAWGYLTGHYIKAYAAVYGLNNDTRKHIYGLLAPFAEHVNTGCINGVAEVFDGNGVNPEGKGCYNQAWSIGTLLEAMELCTGSVNDISGFSR